MRKNDLRYKLKLLLFLVCLLLAGLACRIFPAPALPGSEIPISTEAAGALDQAVKAAIQQAEVTKVFELSLTEEQLTSYVAIKLQEQENVLVTNPQLFLRDGKLKAFGEVEQNSIILPLDFEVEPLIVAGGVPQLVVIKVRIAGVAAPDALVKSIQQVIDQAYAAILQDAGGNIAVETITINEGVLSLRGILK